jgi:hypothetical protein
MRHIACLLLAGLFCYSANTQVVVNEFSAANYSLYNFGEQWNPQFDDWVELYNTGAEADISGYYLSDDIDNPMKWAFPNGTVIGAGEHLLVPLSGWDTTEIDGLAADFGLQQTGGEALLFSDEEGQTLEGYEFWGSAVLKADHSLSRETDGGDIWWTCATPTPGETNGGTYGMNFAFSPSFSHEAGHYESPIELELDPWSDTHLLYYTLDGTEPTEDGNLYVEPIAIDQTTVVKVMAVPTEGLWLPGFIITNTYFINVEPHTLPIVSISGPELIDGLWQNEIRHLTDCEIFDTEFNRLSISHGESNEHGNDSNAFGQRGFDYIVLDSRGYDHDIEYPLFEATDRDRFKRLIFRAGGSDNFPDSYPQSHVRDAMCQLLAEEAELNLDIRRCEHCVVYINGEYWGLYEMREKVDDREYFEEYYDVEIEDVTFLKTWGGTWAECGDLNEWDEITGMVETGEFCWAPTYDDISEILDINSLIDYFILNSYVVNAGWLNWDQAWWKAEGTNSVKWKYALWDLDQTLGNAINFTGIPDMTATASPCDFQLLMDPGGQGHVPLVNALFESPDFEAAFHSRYMELIEGPFSCGSIQQFVDSIHDVMLPEMPRQVERWAFNDETVETWEEAYGQIEGFLLERCEVIEDLVDECWDGNANEGGWDLTVEVVNDGSVDLNGIEVNPDNTPYLLEGFTCDMLLDLLAIDGTDGFVEWQVEQGSPDIGDGLDPSISVELEEDIHLVAVFDDGTGIKELAQQIEFFPNPATDQITISAEQPVRELSIMDLTGRVVQKVLPLGLSFQIDITPLASGVYAIVVESGDHRFCEQFIKQ